VKKLLPGVKGPRIVGLYEVSQLLPDETRPVLKDTRQRNLYLQAALWSTHDNLAVSDTEHAEGDGHPERIRAVQVSGVAGGTVTVQVQVEGADVFLDAERPVSGGEPEEASAPWIFTAGTPVTTIIEATSGTPTGEAHVDIATESYVLLSRFVPVQLRGRERLRTSKRKAAKALNIERTPPGAQAAARLFGYSASGTTGIIPLPGDTRPADGGTVYTTTASGSSIRRIHTPISHPPK
jgi:hypothetical protein